MFKKLLFKMTIFYTLILALILLIGYGLIYFILIHYNEQQLSAETETMLKTISESEWMREQDDTDKPTVTTTATPTIYSQGDNPYEIKIPGYDHFFIPQTLNRFSSYCIYDSDDNLITYKNDNNDLYDKILSIGKALDINATPEVIEISPKDELYYLVAKRAIIIENTPVGYYLIGKDISVVYAMLENLRLVMFVSFLIGLLFSFIFGLIIAEKTIKPIRASYESKEQFVANASHELRTPISVILLSTDTLESTLEDAADFTHEIIHDIRSEAKSMKSLVENLLFLARSDSSRHPISTESFNLSDLLESNYKHYANIAHEKEVTLIKNWNNTLPVTAEKSMVDTVISILLDNGVKYNKPKGFIKTSGYVDGHKTVLIIEDNGIGMTDEDTLHIFERFYRADHSRTKSSIASESGYGLGLSIAYDIIHHNHGTITVESEFDKGTRFTLTFRHSH